MLTLITIPDVATITASIATYAGGIFDELYLIALAIVGLIVGVMLVRGVVLKAPLNAVKQLVAGRKKGRR